MRTWVTRPADSQSRFRRGGVIAAGLLAIGGLVVFSSAAGASPQPTAAQVQAKVNQLTSQYDQVCEQLDQASEQLSSAQTRLTQARAAVNHANAQFQAERNSRGPDGRGDLRGHRRDLDGGRADLGRTPRPSSSRARC